MCERPHVLVGAPDSLTARVRARGSDVLRTPMLDHGTAVTRADGEALGLEGDEVLFHRLLSEHPEEMLPVVRTPTIGDVIERFSRDHDRPRGVFLSIDEPDAIEGALRAYGLGPDDCDLVVATDSEGILGIGDQGVGGVQIALGELTVHTAAEGIHPRRVVPVVLDVGTDDLRLLDGARPFPRAARRDLPAPRRHRPRRLRGLRRLGREAGGRRNANRGHPVHLRPGRGGPGEDGGVRRPGDRPRGRGAPDARAGVTPSAPGSPVGAGTDTAWLDGAGPRGRRLVHPPTGRGPRG
ncbi:hypothetical protein [Geodermatophilus sp. URMC 62]|uniref:hypothetical protein n=1 Tax=Geodermatophilus sp. URMC 62 TaxID=3423414 RepID=UPI00406CF0DF